MNEELTQSDLRAIHRAMSHASRMERLTRISRIGWTIALAASFGIVALWVVIRKLEAPRTTHGTAYIVEKPAPTPSPTPDDGWGSEPTMVIVSARPERTMEKIVAAAHLCGVPSGVAIRLVAAESGFRQFDSDGRVLRSSAGALGITRIKVSSAVEISTRLNIRNEWENLLAGMCFLRKQYDNFGSWRRALYSYHAGSGTLRQGGIKAHSVRYADGILQEDAR